METKIIEEKKKRKNERGITRIALIVFIITFLILGGVLIQKLSRERSKAEQDEDCISAYADIDNDGTVDGIIYADLAVGGSGIWRPNGYTYIDSYGEFTIPKETDGLKEYYVSQEFYTGDFGTGKVISPVKGTSGKDRFYVMALNDVDSDYHCWYASARESRINDYSSVTKEDFGSGKANTEMMIKAWNNETYGSQNGVLDFIDMWGLDDVQNKYNSEQQWFVPSREEWAAFGHNLRIGKSNYTARGLSDYYWSSSLGGSFSVYYTYFRELGMNLTEIDCSFYVRLSTTF